METEKGRGYVTADRNKTRQPIGVIAIDSYLLQFERSILLLDTRVGQRTDYDKLT